MSADSPDTVTTETVTAAAAAEESSNNADDMNDLEENLDLESFGKKKKKKKKFNLDELEDALPSTSEPKEEKTDGEGGPDEAGGNEEDFDLDLDFSKTKKKKKKKKDLDELVADKVEDEREGEGKENGK